MKRQIVRNLDTDHIPLDRLSALLQTFALKHAARELPEILERAELNIPSRSSGNRGQGKK